MSKKAPTKEELIAIFNIIDKDHSGSVDVNELYEALGIL
jgi:Ca2+-binding EF-hand superfamily protein